MHNYKQHHYIYIHVYTPHFLHTTIYGLEHVVLPWVLTRTCCDVCECMCVCMCVCVCVNACVYACVCVNACVYACVCVCVSHMS